MAATLPPDAAAASAPPSSPPGDDARAFALDVELLDGYAQRVDFGLPGVAPLTVDEPPPLGALAGPNPARVLGAALATCLGASLLFCLRRGRVEVHGLRTHVHGTMTRNERGRLRVGAIAVRLEPVVPAEQHAAVPRCLALFEDYCVVTASVRQGIDVRVVVEPVAPG